MSEKLKQIIDVNIRGRRYKNLSWEDTIAISEEALILIEKALPLHPSVDEWEKITGDKLQENDAVWTWYYIKERWDLDIYKDAKYYESISRKPLQIIVAIPGQGKPPTDWKPE